MTPIESSVGVGEDHEFTISKEGIIVPYLAPAPHSISAPPSSPPSSGGISETFFIRSRGPGIQALDASIREYKKRKILKLMGSTVISKDELKQVIAQLPKLYDGVLDNLLNHSFMSRKELMHIIISLFVEQGEFDQQLSLMLKQAAADWIKEKEKMSSDADLIRVTRIPESKLTRFSSSQAE